MLQAAPLPVVAIVAGIALFFLAAGGREGYRWYRLRNATPTPIDELSAASGTVVVAGQARRHAGTVTAPFSGRECLACGWRVTGLRTIRSLDGNVRVEPRDIDQGREAVPFVVEDGTGRVEVDPDGAALRLAEEWVEDPVRTHDEQGDLVYEEGAVPGGTPREVRYYESRLDEGETVVVTGTVRGEDATALDAGGVGVRIGGGGLLIADTTPKGAANRALRSAIYATIAGVLAVGLLAVVTGVAGV